MKVLKNNVLVRQTEAKTTTSSGIILTGSVETGNKPALVVDFGPDCKHVAIGDEVFLQWKQAMPITWEGEQMALISEDYVEAVLTV